MTRDRLQELIEKFVTRLDDSTKEEFWETERDRASSVMERFGAFLDSEMCEYQIQGYFYDVGGALWKVLETASTMSVAEFMLQSHDEADETTRHRIVKVDKELD